MSTADGSTEKDIKRSWFERIELNEKKELEDEQGLEVRFQNSLNGVAHIPLDNISIPNQLNENIKLKGRERIDQGFNVEKIQPFSHCNDSLSCHRRQS